MGQSCSNCLLNLYTVKHVDNEGTIYYTVPSYNGDNVKDVYSHISKCYPDYKIISLSQRSTLQLLNKTKTIFIFHDMFDIDTVTLVEIYH